MKIILTVIIIGALAVGGFFLRDYFSQSAEAHSLQEQIANDNRTLKVVTTATSPLAGEINSLKIQQEQLRSAIATESVVIPERMNTNDIVRSILNAGDTYGLKVIPLSTTDWTEAKIDQKGYWVFKTNLELNGTQNGVVGFLKFIQNSLYPTLIIENLDLTQTLPSPTPTPTETTTPVPTPTPTPTNAPAPTPEEGPIKASLEFSVYAR